MPSTPTTDDFISAIRASGGRVTAAKRLVVAALLEGSEHLTADALSARVQRVSPDVSTSTIYRILEEFESMNLVVHSHLGSPAAVYHVTGRPHGHLVCETCGATLEISANEFDQLVNSALRQHDFEIDRHHLALSGTCRECR